MILWDNTIERIKKAEDTALSLNPEGYYLNFSGGKDSIVLYHLAQMAGVKFTAHMQLTTVDPPELLKFIKEHYPDVVLHRPEISMFQLIPKKKMLPTRIARYCCQILKEHGGVGYMNLLGIRAAESARRSRRNEIETSNRKKSVSFDEFDIDKEIVVSCVKSKDKLMFSPIFFWKNRDVWNFIRENNLPFPDLYNKGFHRIGCIFCPMASVKEKQLEREMYPKFEYAYKKAIQKLVDENGYGQAYGFTVDEIFDWWISNDSVKNFTDKKNSKQMKIF